MPLTLTNGTYFLISPESGGNTPTLTPYSARGLTQTYEPLASAGGSGAERWLRRDVNGVLRNLVDTRFHKYRSTITCSDGETPCLDDSWVGVTVGVWCAFEFSYPTGGTPARPAVAGSTRTQGGITYYRPALNMMITDIKNSFREYSAVNDWSITLEEI